MKVFLVEMTVTVPVVAEDEDAAVMVLANDPEIVSDVINQQCAHLAEGDDSDVILVAHELRAEDITGADADWSDVVPFGDESDATIAERLLDEPEEESSDGLWSEPQHEDD